MAPIGLNRRAVLLGLTGTTLSACAGSRPTTAPPRSPGGTVLLAYFSRAGENYHNGGRRRLTVGNTQVVADLIGRLIGCDVHRIEAAHPYVPGRLRPDGRPQRPGAERRRPPGRGEPLTSIDRYDTILLGSLIWNVRAPMIMSTFAERLDFTGKTVHPFTTHAMSGLGNTERDYAAACRGATLREGLAVRGEEVADAEPAVTSWLRRIGLLAP